MKKKKNLFEILFNTVEKHFRLIMIVTILLIVIIPVGVWFCYSRWIPCNTSIISADGMLSYLGGTISSFIALFIAFIAIYQSKKIAELEEEQYAVQRREEIKPVLHIELIKKKEYLILKIHNLSSYSARMVYIFDVPLFSYIKANESREKKIVFDIDLSDASVQKIFTMGYEINEDGFPDEIQLYLYDIDNNLITFVYKRRKEGQMYLYDLSETEYS